MLEVNTQPTPSHSLHLFDLICSQVRLQKYPEGPFSAVLVRSHVLGRVCGRGRERARCAAPMCQSSFGFGVWATLHFVVRCDAWHCMYYGCSRTGLAAASARALSISVLLNIALSKVSLVPLCLEEYRNVGFTHKLCPCLLGAPYVPSKEMILYQKFR